VFHLFYLLEGYGQGTVLQECFVRCQNHQNTDGVQVFPGLEK